MNATHGISSRYRWVWALTLLVLISGCATQLAPAYDKSVVDGLNAASTETMTLFAAASGGTKKEGQVNGV